MRLSRPFRVAAGGTARSLLFARGKKDLAPRNQQPNRIDPFQSLFDDFFGSNFWGPTSLMRSRGAPQSFALDIAEDKTHFHVKCDMPGFNKNDIQVKATPGRLTISASRTTSDEKDEERDGLKYHRVERSSGSYSRALNLPTSCDLSKIESSFKDGVLSISIPRPSEAPEHVVAIKD